MGQVFNFNAWATEQQSRIEHLLDAHMPQADVLPHKLHEAMRYACLGGGKRVRALLTFAAGEFCQANPGHTEVPAMAVELVHAFSLVHDDMPCMDDDDLRRGKPSTHKLYDDATALLTGDALQTLAFELIASPDYDLAAANKIQILHTLAYATGSRGMAGGQSIDLESTGVKLTQPALETMHAYKTGALIHAATMMGVYSANDIDLRKEAAIDTYAKAIGLAFQVVDDVLDAEADTATLGKTAGKDADNNKSTYVTLLGLDAAKEMANDLHKQAITAIADYNEEANALRGIADFVIQRAF